MTAVDVIVQLAICFICLTMGSSEKLRRFKMTLEFTSGAPKLVFSLIKDESVEETNKTEE